MKTNRFNKKLVALIVVVVLIGVGVARHGKKQTVQVKKEVPNVTVQKVSMQNVTSEVDYACKLQGVQSVTVSPKTSGKVATVNVNVGDKVSAGQVIFTLDTSDLNAQLQEQQAALDAANANLAKTSGTSLTQAIQTSEQQVAKDQITYNNAKDNYDKTQQLYNAGAVAQQSLDDAKTALDTATVQLNSDQQNLDLQKQQIGPQSVQAAQAQVQQSQASVDYVRNQISESTITSPINGVVSDKNVDIGEVTSGTVGTVTIIDTSSLIAEVTVPDNAIGQLKVGQSVPVVVTAAGSSPITGVIDTISPDVNSKDNSYTVKVKIDNSNGSLMSGMFAKVTLPNQTKDNALVVPNEAVKIENGVDYIYTVQGGKVKKVIVGLGISNDTTTEITGSVQPGTEIITEGQTLLSDGEKVNVAK
jgi:multidrug efflux pump subunit AcrA (membrane-fusion protein)